MTKDNSYRICGLVATPVGVDHFNRKSLNDALDALRDASKLPKQKEKRYYDVKGQKDLDYNLE